MTNRDKAALAESLRRISARLRSEPSRQRAHAGEVADIANLQSREVRMYFVEAFVQQALEAEMSATATALDFYIAEYLTPKPRKPRQRTRR